MTETDLTEISGIGPSRAESLREAGFEYAEDVATAPLSMLEEPLGPSADPEEIRSNALDATADDDVEETTDEEGGASSDGEDPRGKTRTLTIDDRDTAIYLVGGLIDENLRLKMRNKYDEADEIVGLINRMMDEMSEGGGEIDVDLDDLSVLYTSVRNVEQEFQGTRGITDLVGQMRSARVQIQELRSELWPNS